MADRRFVLSKGPHLRKADFPKVYGTGTIMKDLFIALLPLVLFGFLKNGLFPFIHGDTNSVYEMLRPLIMVIVGTGTSYLIEVAYFALFFKEKEPFRRSFNSYSVIPGLLISMIAPLYTPLWVLMIGVIFGEIIGKMLFGGFGYNIFNPALIGYVFIATAFYGVISKNGGYLNPTEIAAMSALNPGVSVDALTAATPLATFKDVLSGTKSLDELFSTNGSLLQCFLGNTSGSMCETSAMLCLVSYVYLVVCGVIDWKTPLVFIGSVFVFSYIVGAFIGYAGTLKFALFNVLSGGVVFGGVFMVTEPVTSPRDPLGKLFYAIFIALVAMMVRYLTGFNEGVATAILFMNMFTPILDIKCAQLRVQEDKKKMVLGYSIFAIIAIAIIVYTVLSVTIK